MSPNLLARTTFLAFVIFIASGVAAGALPAAADHGDEENHAYLHGERQYVMPVRHHDGAGRRY